MAKKIKHSDEKNNKKKKVQHMRLPEDVEQRGRVLLTVALLVSVLPKDLSCLWDRACPVLRPQGERLSLSLCCQG